MKIPTFEEIMLSLLKLAEDGKIHSLSDSEKRLSKFFQLTEAQRTQKKPSGRETIFLGRIRWARLYLRKAGLIFDPKKAHYKITDSGKDFLKKNHKLEKINKEILMNIPEFEKWQNETNLKKKESRKNKKPTEGSGVIIFIDALGTKGIWKTKHTAKITKQWRTFTTDLQDDIISKLSHHCKVSFHSFSDTIIIAVITKKIGNVLYEISGILSSYIIESMIIERPIRGCISVGEIIIDERLVAGEAVDEAAEYYVLPQWIGISAGPSAHYEIEKLNRRNPKDTNSHFQQFDLPLKNSIELGAWAINWTEFSNELVPSLAKKHGERYEDIVDIFSRQLKKPSNVEIGLKWRNTLKFFDLVREN